MFHFVVRYNVLLFALGHVIHRVRDFLFVFVLRGGQFCLFTVFHRYNTICKYNRISVFVSRFQKRFPDTIDGPFPGQLVHLVLFSGTFMVVKFVSFFFSSTKERKNIYKVIKNSVLFLFPLLLLCFFICRGIHCLVRVAQLSRVLLIRQIGAQSGNDGSPAAAATRSDRGRGLL